MVCYQYRVYADMNIENVKVARFIFRHPERGPDRGSFITHHTINVLNTFGLMFTLELFTFTTVCLLF